MGYDMVDDEHYMLFDDRCFMDVVVNCGASTCILGDLNKIHRICDDHQYGNQGAEKELLAREKKG